MNSMPLKILLVSLLMSLAAFTVQKTGNDAILDRVGEKIRSGMVFEAEMAHQFVDAFTQDTVYSHGRIWVGEKRYKVVTRNQVILVDGEQSTVYNADQNKVILSTYHPEDDDFAPSRFLGNSSGTFVIRGNRQVGPGLVAIDLESTDPFEVIRIARLEIRTSDLVPMEIYAEDQGDNTYSTRFNNGRFIALDDEIFTIDWPGDAEVIDLRED